MMISGWIQHNEANSLLLEAKFGNENLCHSVVCRMFESVPFFKNPAYMAIPLAPLYLFSEPLTFDNILLAMKYGINTKMNSQGKVISSCLEDYKTTLHAFLKATIRPVLSKS